MSESRGWLFVAASLAFLHILARGTEEVRFAGHPGVAGLLAGQRFSIRIDAAVPDNVRVIAVAETRPEHFDKALADGKAATKVFLRRIRNHALGMEWKENPQKIKKPEVVQVDFQASGPHHNDAVVERS